MFCLLFFVSRLLILFPQPGMTVTGMIMDSSTGQPIPYCNVVSVADPSHGAISNVRGDFILSGLLQTDSLDISQVGYHSVRVSVNDISETLYLEPQIYELDAATVLSLDFPAFIPKVKDNIKHLFVESYPVIEGVFRKQIVENQEYVFMGECTVAVRNTKRFSADSRVSIIQSAVTVNDASLAGHGIKMSQTLASNLVLYPYVYIFDEPVSDNMRWEFRDLRYSDNGKSEIYVLSYEYIESGQTKERGLVYVRAEDYGIIRIDREMTAPVQTVREFKMTTDKITATYQYQQMPGSGKYLLRYSRMEWCFSLSGEGVNNEYIMATDFLVTSTGSDRKSIRNRADKDPFEIEKNSRIVEKSDLRVIPPDYE